MSHSVEKRASHRGRAIAGLLTAGAGLLGMAGVALSAAATHAGGGALGTTAGLFCLLHAAAILALASALPLTSAPRLMGGAATVLLIGTAVFAGDLALAAFGGSRPFPLAAPLGGTMLIVGWALTVMAGVVASIKR